MLKVRDFILWFGNVIAFEDVSFDVVCGELFVVIGSNGVGKMLFFNVFLRVY